ncbi:MAG: radical SAM protein [bacterium]
MYCEWEITSRCNMQCEFCSTLISDRNRHVDTSTREAQDIIRSLSDAGTAMIHFSGGEPTLRKDLPELITTAKRKNMFVFVTTNGSASLDMMKNISHADVIRVSIDGTEAFHDQGRKSPGAFKKAVGTVKFLRDIGAKPQITTIFMPGTTIEMLEELSGIAQKLHIQISINVMGRNVNDPSVIGEGTDINVLSRPLFDAYRDTLQKLQKKFGNVIANPEPLLSVINCGGLDVYGCRAMDIAVTIKHDGSISLPCNGLSIQECKGSIKEVYYSKEALQIRNMQGTYPACKGCYIKCMSLASSMVTIKGLMMVMDSYRKNIR